MKQTVSNEVVAGEQLKIALDMNGFDHGYQVVADAIIIFANKNPDVLLYLYGSSKKLTSLIKTVPKSIHIVSAKSTILQNSSPLLFRHHPESSLVKSIRSLKMHNVDGLVSGNNSGCLLAASSMMLGDRTAKFNRPFFCATLPNVGKNAQHPFVMFADCGANLSLKDEYYMQMTKTCIKYFGNLIECNNVDNLSVGLLNVGHEKHKGNEEMQLAYQIIAKNPSINFVGNIEPSEVLQGKADIVICNGLIGNIFIKTLEGSLVFFKDQLRQLFTSKIFLVGLGLLAKKKIQALKKQYEATSFAYLLGLSKPIIKIHGNSNERQIYVALNKICQIVVHNQKQQKLGQQHVTTSQIGQGETKARECFTSEALLKHKIPQIAQTASSKVILTITHKQKLAKTHERVAKLLKYLKIKPININLYVMALTHVSWSRHHNLPIDFNYERLEYSGDRAINFFISQYLDKQYPNASQGQITKLNSRLISNENLANVARFIQINEYANFGPQANLKNVSTKILASMFEALIGAIQRDHQQSIKCQKLIQNICDNLVVQCALKEQLFQYDNDYKSQLQEYLLNKSSSTLIEYRSKKTEITNKKIYHTECLYLNGVKILCKTALKKSVCHQQIAKTFLERKGVVASRPIQRHK